MPRGSQQTGRRFYVVVPCNSDEGVTLSAVAAQSLVGGILPDLCAFTSFGHVFGIELPAAGFVLIARAGTLRGLLSLGTGGADLLKIGAEVGTPQ